MELQAQRTRVRYHLAWVLEPPQRVVRPPEHRREPGHALLAQQQTDCQGRERFRPGEVESLATSAGLLRRNRDQCVLKRRLMIDVRSTSDDGRAKSVGFGTA